jgi:hypothetical protein
MYVVYGMFFVMLNHPFNFIDIFIPVSGCVGIGPIALLYLGTYNDFIATLTDPTKKDK